MRYPKKREDEKTDSLPKTDKEFVKANRRYLLLGKAKRALWWVGLVLLFVPVFVEWIGGISMLLFVAC